MLPLVKNTDAANKLYVITAITNPCRYRSRYDLYNKFAKYVADSGAELFTVEAAFGQRPHSITGKNVIQLRTSSEIWHKENLLNIGISRLPPDWEYVAWVDADVIFARPDWVAETLHLLQHHQVIQMFSLAQDLGPTNEPINTHKGFVSQYHAVDLFDVDSSRSGNLEKLMGRRNGYNKLGVESWHPGYAWAARREAIDHLGGLIDWAILGSADRHMAYALVGQVEKCVEPGISENYKKMLFSWQERAEKHIKRNVGFMPGLLLHYWHGNKKNRSYSQRWNIVIKNGFDPELDLKKDWQGVWQLTDRSSSLRDDLRSYFWSRNEDSIDC